MKSYTPNKAIVIVLWAISLAAIGILLLQTYLTSIKEAPSQIQLNPAQNISNKETLSPHQFKENFNAASNRFGSHIKIESLNIQTGVYQDTFNIGLQRNINLLGILDEDGMVRSITLIGLSDQSFGADTDTAMAIAILIAAFDPSIEILNCYQIIKDAASSSNGEIIRYGKRYFYTRTADNKIMFSVGILQSKNNGS